MLTEARDKGAGKGVLGQNQQRALIEFQERSDTLTTLS